MLKHIPRRSRTVWQLNDDLLCLETRLLGRQMRICGPPATNSSAQIAISDVFDLSGKRPVPGREACDAPYTRKAAAPVEEEAVHTVDDRVRGGGENDLVAVGTLDDCQHLKVLHALLHRRDDSPREIACHRRRRRCEGQARAEPDCRTESTGSDPWGGLGFASGPADGPLAQALSSETETSE